MGRFIAWAVMLFLWSASASAFAVAGLSGDWLAWCWFAVQMQGLTLAVVNELGQERADKGVGGVAVPLLYLSASVCAPVGAGSTAGRIALAAIAVAILCTRAVLGRSFSVGGSTWLGLVERGPYRCLRHPMIALDCLARLAMVAAWPSVVNASGAFIFCTAMLGVVVLEERWLMGLPEYRSYAGRVRWRLVPGLW